MSTWAGILLKEYLKLMRSKDEYAEANMGEENDNEEDFTYFMNIL